jgi:uncharacterized membrane protein (DUF485 family)
MEKMFWYYDVAAALFIIAAIVLGAKRGFSKKIIQFIVNLVFVAVAAVGAVFLTDSLYESYVMDSIRYAVDETTESFDVSGELQKVYTELTLIEEVSDTKLAAVLRSEKDMDKKLHNLVTTTSGAGDLVDKAACTDGLMRIIKDSFQSALAEKIPPCSGRYFAHLNELNKEETFTLLNMLYNDDTQLPKYIEENYIHNEMVNFVKRILFIVSAMILMIIASFIFTIAFRGKDMNSNGKSDSVLGAFLGILNGAMFLLIIALFIKMLIYSGVQADGVFDENALENTYVFRYFYNADSLFIK